MFNTLTDHLKKSIIGIYSKSKFPIKSNGPQKKVLNNAFSINNETRSEESSCNEKNDKVPDKGCITSTNSQNFIISPLSLNNQKSTNSTELQSSQSNIGQVLKVNIEFGNGIQDSLTISNGDDINKVIETFLSKYDLEPLIFSEAKQQIYHKIIFSIQIEQKKGKVFNLGEYPEELVENSKEENTNNGNQEKKENSNEESREYKIEDENIVDKCFDSKPLAIQMQNQELTIKQIENANEKGKFIPNQNISQKNKNLSKQNLFQEEDCIEQSDKIEDENIRYLNEKDIKDKQNINSLNSKNYRNLKNEKEIINLKKIGKFIRKNENIKNGHQIKIIRQMSPIVQSRNQINSNFMFIQRSPTYSKIPYVNSNSNYFGLVSSKQKEFGSILIKEVYSPNSPEKKIIPISPLKQNLNVNLNLNTNIIVNKPNCNPGLLSKYNNNNHNNKDSIDASPPNFHVMNISKQLASTFFPKESGSPQRFSNKNRVKKSYNFNSPKQSFSPTELESKYEEMMKYSLMYI